MEYDFDRRIDLVQDPSPRQRLHEKVAEMLEAPSEVDDLLVDHAFGRGLRGLDDPTEYSRSPARARAMGLRELDQFAFLGQDAAFVNIPASVRVSGRHLGAGNKKRVFDYCNLRRTGANPDLSQRFLDVHHQVVEPVEREVINREWPECVCRRHGVAPRVLANGQIVRAVTMDRDAAHRRSLDARLCINPQSGALWPGPTRLRAMMTDWYSRLRRWCISPPHLGSSAQLYPASRSCVRDTWRSLVQDPVSVTRVAAALRQGKRIADGTLLSALHALYGRSSQSLELLQSRSCFARFHATS